MRVIIDGVEYMPANEKIGIAITTHNRPDMLSKSLDAHKRLLPPGAVIVIVDDGSITPALAPEWVKLIRHDRALGIAAAKNSCIAALMDAGCDHLFLFDDDTWPSAPEWWLPYVRSPQPHLMYIFGEKAVYHDDDAVGYPRPRGCMLYATREVITRVGGMDTAFCPWGFEHESWSDRIHNAGFTTCRYQDVPDSKGLFYACDEKEKIESSVPEIIRNESRPQLAEEKRYSAEYIDYRNNGNIVTKQKNIALSVLIPSVDTRWQTFGRKIQEQIFGQYEALLPADRELVEILILTDTKSIQLGDKRNELVRLASGDYVVFVDDDDRLELDYLSALLAATAVGADVITFQVKVSLNGQPPRLCRYSLKYAKDENTPTEYHRLPNHICAVKRSLALRTPFPSKLCGEDKDYAVSLRPLLRTEHAIDRVLYHYDYDEQTTETQTRQKATREIIIRGRPPVIDVVMLSKGDTDERRKMTQHAIDTCRRNAGGHSVNVVVVEQQSGVRYRDAITLHKPGKFRYNANANRGIKTGSAQWVMVANNDLEFLPGWLEPLLKTAHQCMSPKSPGESRQAGITNNQTGTANGKNFSGWCFVLSRTLWEKIGGLDEDFNYWCCDDSVIEQVKKFGVTPMLVPASQVKHLVSKTGGSQPEDSMTWANVVLFERKYGIKKFDNDPRYAAYKKRMGIA